MWICECECGNIKPIRGSSLRNGHSTSCGCLTYENASKANKNDLTGRRFGQLVVLKDSGKRSNHRVIWKCLCDCGREIERLSDTLIQGDSNSCGHCNRSSGSIIIETLLKESNIEYEMEKTFPNLVGKNNVPYRYDFYLPKINRLIEFDGIQHYKERSIFSDSLEEIQYRDKIKNNYALTHNIDLIRIPYWKIESITIQAILGEKYLIEE